MKLNTKPKPSQGADGRFLSGNIGGGRPTGSRNRLSEDFLEALCNDFAKHGGDVIERVRQNEPGAYLRVIASLLPKRFEAETGDPRQMTDAELMRIIGRDSAGMLPGASVGKARH